MPKCTHWNVKTDYDGHGNITSSRCEDCGAGPDQIAADLAEDAGVAFQSQNNGLEHDQIRGR